MDQPTDDPERTLAVLYAPVAARAAVAAILALDDALADVVRQAREPALAQLRYAWWRERLAALDSEAPPAMPVLADLAAHALPRGVSGAALADLVDGWEALAAAETLDAAAIDAFAAGRGATLFALLARACGAHKPPVAAGEGWALADLAGNLGDPVEVAAVRAVANARLAAVRSYRWPRSLRTLGAMALLARLDLDASPGDRRGSPGRVARLLWMRVSGR